MYSRIYLDNAATTPIIPEVQEVMLKVIQDNFGNPSSIHTEGRIARSIIEKARKTIAYAINASIGEIFFTSGGTESNNTAIKCAAFDLGVKRIITSRVEHHCTLHSIDRIAHLMDVQVHYVQNDQYGRINLDHLEELLQGEKVPTLVSIMHANNEVGTLNPIKQIGEICFKYGAYFHSDTVQTIAHLPMDVNKFHIDFLSGSAHKFHGPKGIGFIFISNKVQIKPLIDGGSQERNMRGGTENIYGIAGMAKAMELCIPKMEEHTLHIKNLRGLFIEKLLQAFPEIRINGCPNDFLPTVLNVSFPPSPKNEMLIMLLDIYGISCSGGSACSSGSEKPSHVIEAIGQPEGYKNIRFSMSHLNTIEEVERTVDILQNEIYK